MLEQFSATIEKLYAAAAGPALWQEALRAVEDYTGSTGAVLNLVPNTADGAPLCLAGSFSEDDCAEYAINYMWRCPRIAYGEAHPDVPIHYDSMILSEYEMDRDATYEWYGKHGLRYYVAGWIGATGTHRAYMSLQRSRRQGHVEPDQVEQFGLVLKHMEQAVSLAVKLGTLEQRCRFNLTLLDQVRHAIFALDDAGRVVLTNAKADRLLSAGDALVLFQGRLQCRLGSQQTSFARLITAARAPQEGGSRGGWTRIHSASGQKALVAFVAPLVRGEGLFKAFEPKTLVIISDPAETSVFDEHVLGELFGLTLAEARLASALSVWAQHRKRGCPAGYQAVDSTVRTQVRV
jgi:hypothetical protein